MQNQTKTTFSETNISPENLDIESILHQRAPYLMVSKVLDISKYQITVEKIHSGDEGHFLGHFPHAPVVPGAILQEICTQAAGILITKYYAPLDHYDSRTTKGYALGVLKRVNYAKFMDITFPTKRIMAKVDLVNFQENLFKFKAEIVQDDKVKAKFSFNLANLSDQVLFEKNHQ